MKELSEMALKKKCKTCKNKETDLCHITHDIEGKLKCVNYKVEQKTTVKLSERGYGQGFYEGQMLERKSWKDKIKAKIKEYDDKGMTVNLANRSAGKTFQQAVHYEVKKVLQSLLEEE